MITSKEILDKAEQACVGAGLESFIILTPPDDDGKLAATFHHVKSNEAINLFINFLSQAIDHELAGNSYSKDYAKIFQDFQKDFKSCVATVNKKVEKWNSKNSGE
jgi:hypothetical protein